MATEISGQDAYERSSKNAFNKRKLAFYGWQHESTIFDKVRTAISDGKTEVQLSYKIPDDVSLYLVEDLDYQIYTMRVEGRSTSKLSWSHHSDFT